MDDHELKILDQFLAGNWYDRPESDRTIVQEYVAMEHREYVDSTIRALADFLASSRSPQIMSDFIRQSAWRHFPEDVNAPVDWLRGIKSMLEDSLAKKVEGT